MTLIKREEQIPERYAADFAGTLGYNHCADPN